MFKKVVNAIEILAAIAAVVFVVMLFVAEPDSNGADATTNGSAYLSETGALPVTGAEIYAARCATCHGSGGEGGTGPRLAGRVADRFPDVEDQISVVTKGRGTMPSFGGSLSDDDIESVVEHTRTELGS